MKTQSEDSNFNRQGNVLSFKSKLSIDIITDPEKLWLLKEKWDELYHRAENAYFTESFEWHWHCWHTISNPRGDRLYCSIVSCEEQILLILPLVITRKRYFFSVLQPLAFASTEYSEVLIQAAKNNHEVIAIIELAWQSLIRDCPADIIDVKYVKKNSLLHQGFVSLNVAPTEAGVASHITWDTYENWDSYYQMLGQETRKNLRRRSKRLTELGALTFEILGKDDAYQENLQWLIQTKQNWATEKNISWTPFTFSYIDFLFEIMGHGDEYGRIQLAMLKLDGKPIAGQLIRIDKTRAEFVIASYDSAYSMYSPSQLITVNCIQWAFEQHLVVDFRLGDASHKRDWLIETCELYCYEIPHNYFGKAFCLAKSIYHKARMFDVA